MDAQARPRSSARRWRWCCSRWHLMTARNGKRPPHAAERDTRCSHATGEARTCAQHSAGVEDFKQQERFNCAEMTEAIAEEAGGKGTEGSAGQAGRKGGRVRCGCGGCSDSGIRYSKWVAHFGEQFVDVSGANSVSIAQQINDVRPPTALLAPSPSFLPSRPLSSPPGADMHARPRPRPRMHS